MKFGKIVSIVLVIFCLSNKAIAINNGTQLNLQQGPIVIVITESGTCTGIHVGERQVLTAAHCLKPGAIQVASNGIIYNISSKFIHSGYKPNIIGINDSLKYNIAILVTSKKIEGPILPIMLETTVVVGETLGVAAYGLTETAASISENGRIAEFTVDSIGDGMFYSFNSPSKPSVCPGDAGGAIIKDVAGVAGVVGVIVGGSNSQQDGRCINNLEGANYFINLGSSYLARFLKQLLPVQKVSAKMVTIQGIIDNMEQAFIDASEIRSKSVLRGTARESITLLRGLLSWAPRRAKIRIRALIRALKPVRRLRTHTEADIHISGVLGVIDNIRDLGVNIK